MALFSQRRGGRLHEGNLAVLLRRLGFEMAWLQQSSRCVLRKDITLAYSKKARPARTVALCRVESSEHSRRGFTGEREACKSR